MTVPEKDHDPPQSEQDRTRREPRAKSRRALGFAVYVLIRVVVDCLARGFDDVI